ncbi:hypothetical protein GGI09_003312 [Coemansia sp. S100]|nr:hypothetical protein GGI09_003312 [Coemansia sp. S100]KAJ2098982.1 hypothetical protein GGI16_004134 [Coemansia sp. S142-1]
MQPVDITRSYYASRRPVNGTAVRQSMVSVIIEYWRLGSSADIDNDQPTKVSTTAVVIRQAKHRHHHCHHYYHPHEYHGHGYMVHASHPTLSAQATSVAGFAATELGFLAISLALSILLLVIGYKIGDFVCNYELLRGHNRGRGHKGWRVRCQTLSSEKQPIYIEDDSFKERYEGPDVVWAATEPLVVSKDVCVLNI